MKQGSSTAPNFALESTCIDSRNTLSFAERQEERLRKECSRNICTSFTLTCYFDQSYSPRLYERRTSALESYAIILLSYGSL